MDLKSISISLLWPNLQGAVALLAEEGGNAKDPDIIISGSKADSLVFENIFTMFTTKRGLRAMKMLQQANLLVKQMKPILDPRPVYFGFYKNEPVSFFLSLPK